MKPIEALTADEARGLSGVLFDLDDTVLDHGALTPPAFEALCRLGASDLVLVAVTGRPAAWGQVLVRQWPLHGMVTENGNIALLASGRRIDLLDRLAGPQRSAAQAKLSGLASAMTKEFPALTLADGGLGRLSDVSFDIAEHTIVEPTTVERAIHFAEERGARTSVSSIHLHVTFDTDDKATGTLRFLSATLGMDPTRSRAKFAFIGDSGNDAAAFAAFDTTIGVANLTGRFTRPPRYRTRSPRGAGFAEAANLLLARRE